MTAAELRIGVIGAGAMGSDHIKRITRRISGARVSAVVEPDETRAQAAVQNAPGAQAFGRIEDALEAGAVDAVLIATPGFLHEAVLLPALEAKLPILCEKPLTPDPESSWRVLEAEQASGARRIQVGFMRRFDPEYRQLRELVSAGTAGELLMVRAAHRNASVPEQYQQDMLITDSVVHELDVLPWLAGAELRSLEVKLPRRNSLTPERLQEPILVLMELSNGVLVDLEMNVSVQFGYQVTTEAVFESGVARIGENAGLQLWQAGRTGTGVDADFTTRFATAYDEQVQRWVDAARAGLAGTGSFVDGPDAWDGYRVAVACQQGVKALHAPGTRVEVELPERPAFYR